METVRDLVNYRPRPSTCLNLPTLVLLLLLTCLPALAAAASVRITYPLDQALFPRDMVAPVFKWTDPADQAEYRIELSFASGGEPVRARVKGLEWRPEPALWEKIKEAALEEKATFSLIPEGGDGRGRAAIGFSVSKDPVEAPIFFRQVPLPFAQALKNLESIRWSLGDPARDRPPKTVLTNMKLCGNCHSFSADGRTLAMDVDYGNDKGSYIITPTRKEMTFRKEEVISWSDYQRSEDNPTFGLLARISPDGRYAVSTVKDRSVFVPRRELHYSQFFFPVRGILAFYDRLTKKLDALPGADDPDLVQSNPAWSPDGKEIVFARDKAFELPNLKNKKSAVITEEEVREFISGEVVTRYNLYRLPFNEGRGGTPVPVTGASHNGFSNFFPKYSPDGKWIVFCRAKGFMLLRPDSNLYIIPAQGGEARKLGSNFFGRMNSWHSFSPNSRWLVFASKANGPYTQLWLTHIDDQGRDSVPVLLEHLHQPELAANIPEFVNLDFDGLDVIRQDFLEDFDLLVRSGEQKLSGYDFAGAAREFAKAVKIRPDHVPTLIKLTGSLLNSNQPAPALEFGRRAARLAPENPKPRYLLALIQAKTGELRAALRDCREAIRLDPGLFPARQMEYRLLLRLGEPEPAAKAVAALILEKPRDAGLRIDYGQALLRLNRPGPAIEALKKALELDPANSRAQKALAVAEKQ